MRPFKIAVFASGEGTNLQEIIDRVKDGRLKNVEISLVFSNMKKAKALERARNAGIKTLHISSKEKTHEEHEKKLLPELEKHGFDLIVLAGYMRKLTPSFVRKFKDRIINVHPAWLPDYPGLKSIGRAFEDVSHSGVTVHFVDKGVDTGPVIARRNVDRMLYDSPEEFEAKIHEAEHELLPKVIQGFADGRISKTARRVEFRK